jgi:hypothetical protein
MHEHFSPHLFWDMDKSKIDFVTAKTHIVFQVVEYELMSDWILIQKIYPSGTLKTVVLNLRTLDKVTLAYLSHFFQVDKTQFRCYKTSQSAESFWNS